MRFLTPMTETTRSTTVTPWSLAHHLQMYLAPRPKCREVHMRHISQLLGLKAVACHASMDCGGAVPAHVFEASGLEGAYT